MKSASIYGQRPHMLLLMAGKYTQQSLWFNRTLILIFYLWKPIYRNLVFEPVLPQHIKQANLGDFYNIFMWKKEDTYCLSEESLSNYINV